MGGVPNGMGEEPGARTCSWDWEFVMYPLQPPSIHILARALDDPRSAARIERMLAAVGRELGSVEVVPDRDIPDLVARQGWADTRRRQGAYDGHREPAWVFGTMRFEDTPSVGPVLADCPPGTSAGLVANLLGRGGRGVMREQYTSPRGVCRARVQFDTVYGCPHGCVYCGAGHVAVIHTNLEEFVTREVIPAAEAEPWQKVFMFNSSLSDTLCWEPEYGLSKLVGEYFAGTADQHYLIHTKAANVDFLAELDHRGRTILLWSLCGETASRVIEPGTASPDERIEAARKCQAMGLPVRFKLKPIVPVRGWREEYAALVCPAAGAGPAGQHRAVHAGLDGRRRARTIVDVDLLDPPFLQALRDGAESMRGVTAGPFPHAARERCIASDRRNPPSQRGRAAFPLHRDHGDVGRARVTAGCRPADTSAAADRSARRG